jgi:transcription antitermination factor NusG
VSTNFNTYSSQTRPFVKPADTHWYVVYTKPRNELKVYERLSLMGINAYCPTIVKISQWSDRKKKLIQPALPSMVFVKLKDNERNKVFDCPNVSRYMFYNKKIVTVSQKELDILKNHLEGKSCINTSITNLSIGDHIKVEQFQNRTGKIVNVTNNKLWVKIQSLNIKVQLDIL